MDPSGPSPDPRRLSGSVVAGTLPPPVPDKDLPASSFFSYTPYSLFGSARGDAAGTAAGPGQGAGSSAGAPGPTSPTGINNARIARQGASSWPRSDTEALSAVLSRLKAGEPLEEVLQQQQPAVAVAVAGRGNGPEPPPRAPAPAASETSSGAAPIPPPRRTSSGQVVPPIDVSASPADALAAVCAKLSAYLPAFDVAVLDSPLSPAAANSMEEEGCPFCLHTELSSRLVLLTCRDVGCVHACHFECCLAPFWPHRLYNSHPPLAMCVRPNLSRSGVIRDTGIMDLGSLGGCYLEVSVSHMMSDGRVLFVQTHHAQSYYDNVTGETLLQLLPAPVGTPPGVLDRFTVGSGGQQQALLPLRRGRLSCMCYSHASREKWQFTVCFDLCDLHASFDSDDETTQSASTASRRSSAFGVIGLLNEADNVPRRHSLNYVGAQARYGLGGLSPAGTTRDNGPRRSSWTPGHQRHESEPAAIGSNRRHSSLSSDGMGLSLTLSCTDPVSNNRLCLYLSTLPQGPEGMGPSAYVVSAIQYYFGAAAALAGPRKASQGTLTPVIESARGRLASSDSDVHLPMAHHDADAPAPGMPPAREVTPADGSGGVFPNTPSYAFGSVFPAASQPPFPAGVYPPGAYPSAAYAAAAPYGAVPTGSEYAFASFADAPPGVSPTGPASLAPWYGLDVAAATAMPIQGVGAAPPPLPPRVMPGMPAMPATPTMPIPPSTPGVLSADSRTLAGYAKSQAGSKMLQQQLRKGEMHVDKLLDGLEDRLAEIVVDMFGNYFVQELFRVSNSVQRQRVLRGLAPTLHVTACNRNGTYALQSIVDNISVDADAEIMLLKDGLSRHTLSIINDDHGTHVVQRFQRRFASHYQLFLVRIARESCLEMATSANGVGVLTLCIDSAPHDARSALIDEVVSHAMELARHPYGNYVVQHLLGGKKAGKAKHRSGGSSVGSPTTSDGGVQPALGSQELLCRVCKQLAGHFVELSRHKYSSNVVEQCTRCTGPERDALIQELFFSGHLRVLLQDMYANYVVQTALLSAPPETCPMLVAQVRPQLSVFDTDSTPSVVRSKWTAILDKLEADAGGAAVEAAAAGNRGRRRSSASRGSGRRPSAGSSTMMGPGGSASGGSPSAGGAGGNSAAGGSNNGRRRSSRGAAGSP